MLCVRALWKLSSPVESASCITRVSHPKNGTQDTFPWKDTASPRQTWGRWKGGGTREYRERGAPSFRTAKATLGLGKEEGTGHRPCPPTGQGRHFVQTKQMGGF